MKIQELRQIIREELRKLNKPKGLKMYDIYIINGNRYMYHGINSVGSHIFRSGNKTLVVDDKELKSLKPRTP